jgi:LysR family hydrogen peroxide-inducible transcriptional activator
MAKITLRQLRYFEALALQGHFGRAADTCSVSQPALSVQIKELEQTLGVTLFERNARSVCLTGFGEEFATRAKSILRSVEELEDLARTAKGQIAGKLRLGVIPTIAPYLLPKIISDLTKSHSDLDLHVRETLTPTLIQELADGKLDAAIVALPVSEPAFFEIALFSEKLLLVRPEKDALKPIPDVDMLKEMRLLLLEEGHCFRDQALSFCNIRSALSRDGLDASSLSTLVQMVGVGIGVTLIPEMAVSVETRSAAVSVARFGDPEPSRTIGMIWRKTSPLKDQLLHISNIVRTSSHTSRS